MRPVKAILYADNAIDYYRALPPLPDGLRVVPCATEEAALGQIRGCEVLCCTGMFYPEAIIDAGHELHLLHSISVGMEPLLRPEMNERGLIVTNSRGANAKPVAEHAIALMLALLRNIHLSVRAQANRSWQRTALRTGIEAEGLTLGIVGYGAIGREIAWKAHHLGMKVLAAKRTAPAPSACGSDPFVTIYAMEDLERLLGESDVVTVCLPLTDETRDRIGERELNAMKRNAYLINISRGAVINEDALIAALRDGTIAGAGLDVFHTHPLPPGSPLWEMPQVIVTPYISAASPHTMTRAMEIFADNLLRYSSGVPLRNVVNMKRGY